MDWQIYLMMNSQMNSCLMNSMQGGLKTSPSDAQIIIAHLYRKARKDFWAYRRIMNPKMLHGWWQKLIAETLQQFFEDFIAGKKPKLIIEAPPQHGKSTQVIDFVTWFSGKFPSLRTIYSSYSERLGIRANLRCQRIFDSYQFKSIFKKAEFINKTNSVTVSGQTLRNKEILEFVNEEGYFRNTTVLGAITGEGLDLGIVDDATKGRAEARSKTIKLKTIGGVGDWDEVVTR